MGAEGSCAGACPSSLGHLRTTTSALEYARTALWETAPYSEKGLLQTEAPFWKGPSRCQRENGTRQCLCASAARVVLDAELEGYGPGHGRSGVLPFEQAYGEDYASTPGGDESAPLIMVRPRAPYQMDAVTRIIDERIASGEERPDILSDLLRKRLPDGTRLSRDEIVGEVVQMLYAGHLTIPSSLLSFWRDIAGSDTHAGRPPCPCRTARTRSTPRSVQTASICRSWQPAGTRATT